MRWMIAWSYLIDWLILIVPVIVSPSTSQVINDNTHRRRVVLKEDPLVILLPNYLLPNNNMIDLLVEVDVDKDNHSLYLV